MVRLIWNNDRCCSLNIGTKISPCCHWLCYKWLMLLSAVFSIPLHRKIWTECFVRLGLRRQQCQNERYLTVAMGMKCVVVGAWNSIDLRRGRNWFNFPDNYMKQQGIIFCVIRPSSNVNSKMTNIVSLETSVACVSKNILELGIERFDQRVEKPTLSNTLTSRLRV